MADRLEEKKLIAYCNPWSVAAGEQLDLMVSCLVPGDYNAGLVELICGDSRPHGTGFDERAVDADFAGRYSGREQLLRPGSFAVLPDIPSSKRLSFCCYLKPTLLARDWQPVACGGGLSIDIVDACLRVRTGTEEPLVSPERLRLNRWHLLLASYDSETERLALACRVLGQGAGEMDTAWAEEAMSQPGEALKAGDWHLAAGFRGVEFSPGFNGRIEAPRLTSSVLSVAEADDLLEALLPDELPGGADDLLGAWDFSEDIGTSRLRDVSGNDRHGQLYQTPTRAVKGVRWDGSVQNWRQQPSHYGAIHFHEDDLTDAGWDVDFGWQIPPELPSGVYALKLELDGSLEYVPFFVRPAADAPRAKIAYLASTATYIAYANQRLGFSSELVGGRRPSNPEDVFLMKHPEVGYSLYEYHADGSGVHYSSRLRPILNMKPKILTWSFNADTNITNWLKHRGDDFDVITDEDLHKQGGEALADYDVVITGAHPEYFSTRMLDGVRDYLDDGGRLMYLGGNGFYWRIAHDPEDPAIIEVRRAEGGTRAWMAEPGEYFHAFTGEYGGMWRRLGRPPNELVGVGFAAQGFDGGTYYRLTPQALDNRVAFIMAGVKSEEVIGNYGTQGGGAAGEEIDRFDVTLGSPDHALVLASSEKHRAGMLRVVEEMHMSQPELQGSKVRADMTFFETPVGGAVFSTGSISYAGALAVDDFDNDIARITDNVLNRFLDPAPFEYPGSS